MAGGSLLPPGTACTLPNRKLQLPHFESPPFR
jgi:hypothetical protein